MPPRRSVDIQASVIRWLCEQYPDADPRMIAQAGVLAFRGLTTVGMADDVEAEALAKTIAERELRLSLGLEDEVARLDPEHHRGKPQECSDSAR